MTECEVIYLDNSEKMAEVIAFLDKFNLLYESDIDYTLAVYDNSKLVATASKSRNILKCFAILEEYQGQGITNLLVKKIEDRMFSEGLYHFFIFTPSYNLPIFDSIGYKEIITTNDISLLENGNNGIKRFLMNLKEQNQISDTKKACIIINGNPFTLGHLYLIEKAASENKELIVFVVTEDKSSFPFSVRFKLITEGTIHLANVKVVETGPYSVSNITFPTYFLKEKQNSLAIQTNMDCKIFSTYYKRIFNITRRYIGTEPCCEITNSYNAMMKKVLPLEGIEVIEVERKENNGNIISASSVRALIQAGDFNSLKSLVPKVTYDYLVSAEAVPIIEKIKHQQGRH